MRSLYLILFILILSGCASLKDQAKSRELLAKCKYSLDRVDVENIDFDQIIRLASNAKEINFKKPGKEVIPFLKEIKDLNFDVDFTTLDFKTTIGVDNPNAHDVILDSLVFDAFFDGIKVTNVIHDGPLKIGPKSKGNLDLIFAMPTSYKLKKVMQAETVNLKGRIWLKIELIKGLPFTIPFNFDVKQKVPREQIQKMIDDQKEKVVAKVVKELAGQKAKDLLKKF